MTGLVPPLFLAAAALAADSGPPVPPEPPPPVVRDSIVVVAERGPSAEGQVPAAVSVLDRAEIERLPTETLAEVLDFLPGFLVLFPAGFGGTPMVAARGFFAAGEAEYVQLRVDGVPVADVESGLADWRGLRAASVERVEALRGPGSSLYGDAALGGVVDVVTRPTAVTGAGGSRGGLAASGGSFDTASAEGWLALPAGGPLAVEVTAHGADTGGFRRHSAARESAAELKLGDASGRWRLALAAGERERDDPGPLTAAAAAEDPGGSDPLFRFDHESTERGRLALSYRGAPAGRPLAATLHASRRDAGFLRTLLLAEGVGDRLLRDLGTEAVGGSVEAESAFSWARRQGTLRYGVDASREWLDTGYRAVDETGEAGAALVDASARRDRAAAFLSGSLALGDRLRLASALRWDRLRDLPAGGEATDREALSPRVGLTIRLGKLESGSGAMTAYLAAGRAFRAPTLDQLFDPRPFPDFAGGTFLVSNPNLAPQRARNLEAGLSRGGASRWEAVAYRTTVEDEIDFDPATFRYVNLGASLHTGVELAAWLRRDRRVRPWAAYAWTRAEPTRGPNRGRQLKNIPVHLLRGGASADLPWGMEGELRLTWLGERWLDDAERFPLDDAAVADLRLARRAGPWAIRLDLLNLTGERYAGIGYLLPDLQGGEAPHLFPAPGFAFRLGLERSFGPPREP